MNDILPNIDFAGLAVRRLVPADRELICAHRQAMFLEAGCDLAVLKSMTEHFRPWLEERLQDGRYYGFALMEDELPMAGIGLMNIDWPPHPLHPTQDQRGYVLNVYVAPSHRRRGLASALMKLAEAEFVRRGVGFAVLHATAVGRPVYESLDWAGTSEMAKLLH